MICVIATLASFCTAFADCRDRNGWLNFYQGGYVFIPTSFDDYSNYQSYSTGRYDFYYAGQQMWIWMSEETINPNWKTEIINNCYSDCVRQEENVVNKYKRTYFLSGGMAMHLKLKKGLYNITLTTPVDQQANFTYSDPSIVPFDWQSNTFTYDTQNPTKVIFVYPTYNENGFYDGGWIVDYREHR